MTIRINWTVGWMFLIGFVCLTGCTTTDQAGTGLMASVEISGHTEAEIQKATTAAFLAHGYLKTDLKTDSLIFEKQGSAWETVNYGGLSGGPAWIKIRVKLVSAETGSHTLGCDAYAVEGHGDVGMEIERKFLFAKRTECKKILDEAKAALDAPSEPAGAEHP
jgi:hypothetical protein